MVVDSSILERLRMVSQQYNLKKKSKISHSPNVVLKESSLCGMSQYLPDDLDHSNYQTVFSQTPVDAALVVSASQASTQFSNSRPPPLVSTGTVTELVELFTVGTTTDQCLEKRMNSLVLAESVSIEGAGGLTADYENSFRGLLTTILNEISDLKQLIVQRDVSSSSRTIGASMPVIDNIPCVPIIEPSQALPSCPIDDHDEALFSFLFDETPESVHCAVELVLQDSPATFKEVRLLSESKFCQPEEWILQSPPNFACVSRTRMVGPVSGCVTAKKADRKGFNTRMPAGPMKRLSDDATISQDQNRLISGLVKRTRVYK